MPADHDSTPPRARWTIQWGPGEVARFLRTEQVGGIILRGRRGPEQHEFGC